jgi:transmembrane sensor
MDRNDDLESTFSQAERWMARLNAHDCSAADRRAFEAWRTGAPAHASAYAETERLWSDLALLASDDDVVQWRRQAVIAARGRGTSRPATRHCFGWVVAASLCLCALLGACLLRFASTNAIVAAVPVTLHFSTKPGEIRRVALPDGSSLTLNADTALDARIGPHARIVRLSRGEAVFNVMHEPQRPFVVYAAGSTIRDIGTRFDVNLANAQADITVIEGVVDVEHHDRSATLTQGDQLLSGDGVWRRRSIDPAVVTGWTQGKWVFRGTPLDEVVAQVNRYDPGRLAIADPALMKLPISGDFRIGQTQSLVRALHGAFGIRARFDKASGEIRLSRR